MKTAAECPECGCPLPPLQEGAAGDGNATSPEGDSALPTGQQPAKGKRGKRIAATVAAVVLLCAAAGGGYLYMQHQSASQHEEECYTRLAEVSDPEYYQQFLIDFPQSKHADEIRQRMEALIKENNDWQAALSPLSRNSIAQFMESHPESNRRRQCEDMLDSIDWADAVAQETPEAIDTYLTLHPEGAHVTDASGKKNELAMSKVTPEDKALVRGVLETFLNNGMGKQDTAVIRQCIAADMESFCGTPHATPVQIAAFAQKRMEKDVIGLHYLTGTDMALTRQSMPDGSLGFAADFTIDETAARKDPSQNSERHYRAQALLDAERKIVKLTIR